MIKKYGEYEQVNGGTVNDLLDKMKQLQEEKAGYKDLYDDMNQKAIKFRDCFERKSKQWNECYEEAQRLKQRVKESNDNYLAEEDKIENKPSEERRHQNHHHEVGKNQMVVDFGTGEFVADTQRMTLLNALNECGLITRTHCYGHETGHSFVSILFKNDLRIEVREAVENHSSREFDGLNELLLSWKRTD